MKDDLLLNIKDLHIEARSGVSEWQEIVHGVDLTLNKGEVLGLIGESGAGKSTIGLAAMGYARSGCRISSGQVIFDAVDLVKASSNVRRDLRGKRIAYVAQSAAASFDPAWRLISQYAEAPLRHGVMGREEAYRDAKALYAKMHLPEPETIGFRYPHQVSGGQLQRAMTAMAMACRPDLIIFDEPTTALDVTTQIGVLASIREIVRQFNTAAIYISHDLAVVAQMADRIKVLRYGKEVEENSTAEMLRFPKEAYTQTLWARHDIQRVKPEPPSTGIKPVLRAENLTARYGRGPAVIENISLELYPGRTLAIVGESGSGKSSLARCLTGLLPPVGGHVSLMGELLFPELKRRPRKQRQRIQMIYQMVDTALNPRQKIGDIIGRPLAFYHGLDRRAVAQRVGEILDMIGLPREFASRTPAELSGGQKQRIGIARALAADPEVIICDEITSALDRVVAGDILNLLSRLQAEKRLSFLFITHDMETVKEIADDVIVMRYGKVVDSGAIEKVFTPPLAPYTEILLNSIPEMRPDWLDERTKERGRPREIKY